MYEQPDIMKKLILTVLMLAIAVTATFAADAVKSKVLIFGGGASHDFDRWFNKADVATLKSMGAKVEYTDNTTGQAEAIEGVDVLYLTNNKPYGDDATKAAIIKHVEAGKGAVLVHAGLWYNWPDWPEYNRVLAGGGSRGHDRLGEFEVKVTGSHPILQGVPKTFDITDELYWFETDPKGTPIEVLATARSERKQKDYPMVFIVKHPTARIVAITLGHDGLAHNHPAYQQLLKNALKWVSGGG